MSLAQPTSEMAFVEPPENNITTVLDIDRLHPRRLKLESRTANFGPRPLYPVLPILTVSFCRTWQTNQSYSPGSAARSFKPAGRVTARDL
jgi:hypothetical protein